MLLFIIVVPLIGQDKAIAENGVVSYVSPQNVYVKFGSTETINIGDTLFTNKNGHLIPYLIVEHKSSISCVCKTITSMKMKIKDELFTKHISVNSGAKSKNVSLEKDSSRNINRPRYRTSNSFVKPRNQPIEKENPKHSNQKKNESSRQISKQKIKGRFSATSYNNISNPKSNHRMRYTFSMRGTNLGNSNLSMDSYITFRHKLDEWDEVKNDLNSALKIYSLSLKYDFNENSSVVIGRKINHKISSIGAIDGIQYEKGVGNFLIGAFVGSRPDHHDYSLNLNLFQYGVYFNHTINNKNKFIQNTIAFIEQRNHSSIDRRFIYFQHSSNIFKKLHLFSSGEMSLYSIINNETKNSPSLTNLYVSLRYRISRKLNISTSYDNRKNVIYYESYKSFIDKLIEKETRQGVRLSVNYRPFKYVSWGINSGWRFQKSDKNLSKNINSYLTISRISSLNIRTTINVNFLKTNYLNSRIFGLRVYKDIIPQRLSGGVNLRMVNYKYLNYESVTNQNIVGLNLSLSIIKKLTLYMNYEGTFDDQNLNYHRIITKLIQRF